MTDETITLSAVRRLPLWEDNTPIGSGLHRIKSREESTARNPLTQEEKILLCEGKKQHHGGFVPNIRRFNLVRDV